MRTKIALPLALGIALAIPASAYAALGASGPVHTHRVIHHRSAGDDDGHWLNRLLKKSAEKPLVFVVFA